MQETGVRSLGREDALEEEMATHSRILVWRISWTEEPGSYSPRGRKESDTTERTRFWLRWVFVASHGLYLRAEGGGCSHCGAPFLIVVASLVAGTGSRVCRLRASVIVVCELSCPATHGIFPNQESNPCPLHWKADS